MTRHYPDLGSASDWMKQISTNQNHYPDLGKDTSSVWNFVAETSFFVETRGGVAKCRLFSQASRNTEHSANKVESDYVLLIFLQLLLKDTGSHGVIASLLSWVTSSNNAPPVLWEIKVRESYKVL